MHSANKPEALRDKLKPGYIEFGLVCIHSAIGIQLNIVNPAGQLLLTRRVNNSWMDGMGRVF